MLLFEQSAFFWQEMILAYHGGSKQGFSRRCWDQQHLQRFLVNPVIVQGGPHNA